MTEKASIEKYQMSYNDIELLMAKLSRFEESLDARIMPDPELYLYHEKTVAKMFSISLPTLQELRKEGKISYHQIGKRILYSRKNIIEFHERSLVKRTYTY